MLTDLSKKKRTARGFTLVELLVALMLLNGALLVLVATAAMSTRALNGAEHRERAVALATTRLERMASAPCADDAGADSSATGYAEHWSQRHDGGTRELRDSVEYSSGLGATAFVLQTRAPC